LLIHRLICFLLQKIDQKRDRIGVFVSIVSTKIPFKGTSKEYIGDDATEIQQSVKRALQSCCQQLRVHLQKHHAIKDAKERKSRLAKYIPDVGRSLFAILQGMRERHAELEQQQPSTATVAGSAASAALLQSPTKRLRLDPTDAKAMIRRLAQGQVTEEGIKKSLRSAIDDDDGAEDGNDKNGGGGGGGLKSGKKRKRGMIETPDAIPLFIVPLYSMNDSANDIHHPLFTFRPLVPVPQVEVSEDEVYGDVSQRIA
jgi:DNA topoisomerase VI subunit B